MRPVHEDDEAAHEHVTEDMRKLGEQLLQDGNFPDEDITGQDQPPHGHSPLVPRKITVTRPSGPSREEPMEEGPDVRRRVRVKHELSVQTNQPHRLPMLTQILHDKKQRETMMTREDDSMSLKHHFHQLFKMKLGY